MYKEDCFSEVAICMANTFFKALFQFCQYPARNRFSWRCKQQTTLTTLHIFWCQLVIGFEINAFKWNANLNRQYSVPLRCSASCTCMCDHACVCTCAWLPRCYIIYIKRLAVLNEAWMHWCTVMKSTVTACAVTGLQYTPAVDFYLSGVWNQKRTSQIGKECILFVHILSSLSFLFKISFLSIWKHPKSLWTRIGWSLLLEPEPRDRRRQRVTA